MSEDGGRSVLSRIVQNCVECGIRFDNIKLYKYFFMNGTKLQGTAVRKQFI